MEELERCYLCDDDCDFDCDFCSGCLALICDRCYTQIEGDHDPEDHKFHIQKGNC